MALLGDVLERPLRYRHMYRRASQTNSPVNNGLVNESGNGVGATAGVPRYFCLWGPRGSGKWTAVTQVAWRNQCVVAHVTLEDLIPGALDRLGAAIEHQVKEAGPYAGIVIVFDHCDAYFARSSGHVDLMRDLRRMLKCYEPTLGEFWLCWLSELPPEQHPEFVPAECSVGVDPLSEADRVRVIGTLLQQHHQFTGSDTSLSESLQIALLRAAENCTPGEIHEYMGRVVQRHYRTLSAAEMAAAAQDPQQRADLMRLTERDFKTCFHYPGANLATMASMVQMPVDVRGKRYRFGPMVATRPTPQPMVTPMSAQMPLPPPLMPPTHAPISAQDLSLTDLPMRQ